MHYRTLAGAVMAASLASLAWFGGPAARAGTPAPIVGGTAATPSQFPTVVAIVVTMVTGPGSSEQSMCTGTLVAPTWVLTAGHCVAAAEFGVPQDTVTADTMVYYDTIDAGDPTHAVAAVGTFADPSYTPTVFGTNDIGLVELASPIPGPISRVSFDTGVDLVGTPITIVGFGDDHTGFEYSLQATTVSCSPAGFDDTKVSCITETSMSGIGEGDSGGPWIADVAGRPVVIAATSFLTTLGGGEGAATRTDIERDFLLSHVPTLACTKDADCSATEACTQGTCEGRACAHDADCGDGQACFDGGCIVAPGEPGGIGSTCTTGADCDSNDCDFSGACTIACTAPSATACPDGYTCSAINAACLPSPPSSGGCDAGGSGAGALGSVLLALALLRSRSRARARA